MKFRFLTVMEIEGEDLNECYGKLRRAMLVTPGISDSDTAWQVDMLDHEKQLPEEDLQEARKAYHDHPDLDRMCNGGPECDHRVVYGGLPACYLHQSEVKKMIEWGNQQNRVAKKYKKDHT